MIYLNIIIMASPKTIKNKANMLDTNYSVYIDGQTKSTPPQEDFLQQNMNRIYPKPTREWVDDTIVKQCQSCNYKFGWGFFGKGKHHCRACGGVFCDTCCNIHTLIPTHLIDKPDEQNSYKVWFTNYFRHRQYGNKSLVCVDCNNKINNLLKIEWKIKIGAFLGLKDLFSFLTINREFHNAGIHWLSKFRNIQYHSPDVSYNNWETKILWSLRHNIMSHSNWYLCVIKSVIGDYIKNQNERLDELIKILVNMNIKDKNKKIECWSLMCSRRCSSEFDIIDVMEILQYLCKQENGVNVFWKDQKMRELFTILFNKVRGSTEKYVPQDNIMPLLSVTMRMILDTDKEVNCVYVHEILDIISAKNYNFLIMLTLEYNHLNNTHIKNNGKIKFCDIVKNYIVSRLKPEQKNIIWKTVNVINTLSTNGKNLFQIITKNNNGEIDNNDVYNINGNLPILYPFDTQYHITDIISVKELESNSKPLLVKVKIQKSNNQTSPKIKKKFIIKNDPYLRKENIVSSLISVLQNKLHSQSKKGRLEKFEYVPMYKILMISNQLGIIEYVNDSITLAQISRKGYTLKNYIQELNDKESISVVNERFIISLAISSCLSYILGLGDRHLDNIMINKKGQIFHIDYGYLMENPMTNIFGAPVIRVTSEMIDFVGGTKSKFYSEFKEYVIKIFDILRLYGNVILNYYYILGYEKIINWEDFRKKITNRFLGGLSCKDVEISLIKEIELGSNSLSAYVMDVSHQYGSMFKKLFSN
ncbi:phosphoinositide 3-kinase [Catovirus CTV1]|uniref:Phosphoinositide 3-kinase n=1 Tax=Catovirus CTV1 TaxID=1977631 RepID=A0A1V0SAK1_9VIRU|nr:phosphoinositide 3-kinase [Catovirus CTV1]